MVKRTRTKFLKWRVLPLPQQGATPEASGPFLHVHPKLSRARGERKGTSNKLASEMDVLQKINKQIETFPQENKCEFYLFW